MENIYYVYEWIRLDTNEPFYIGMGHGNRCYYLTRNRNFHFNNIVKSIPVAVNILHENLNRQEAFDLEVWYIKEYRDVIGYDLCNINDGGEGQTLCGEKNPFYGRQHSNETKRKISETKKGKKTCTDKTKQLWSEQRKGKNNGMAVSIICITTNAVFYTANDGAKYYNIKNKNDIGQVCRGKRNYCGKLSDGTKLVWRYITIIEL